MLLIIKKREQDAAHVGWRHLNSPADSPVVASVYRNGVVLGLGPGAILCTDIYDPAGAGALTVPLTAPLAFQFLSLGCTIRQ